MLTGLRAAPNPQLLIHASRHHQLCPRPLSANLIKASLLEPFCEQKLNGLGPTGDYLSNSFVHRAHSVDIPSPPSVTDKPG